MDGSTRPEAGPPILALKSLARGAGWRTPIFGGTLEQAHRPGGGREPPPGARRYISSPRALSHPHTIASMSTPERYDAIVIGAGQAGGPLARALARSGRRTALIEREHVGGTCINEGCTPTKTMVASARVAYLARRAADYGVNTGPVTRGHGPVRERKRAIVKSFRAGSQRRIEATEGLDLICGEARFTGPRAGRGGRTGARGRR